MVLESFIEASSAIMSELRLNSQSFSSTHKSYHQSPHRTRSNQDLNNGSRRRPTTGDARSRERGPTVPRRRKIAHLALHQRSGYPPHTKAALRCTSSSSANWQRMAFDHISFKLRSKLREVCKPKSRVYM
ncbi:hypothetical protein EJ04DRAFT_360850 [Polyplosphaeria fusca]|uniref:Uncharacterized protein n=1 Tax=Polyplosphaeria fusca TaxID=682080 RepID=A0A9P4V143_9PLEO|nr:hypothetical protein EJ04DRAFT_360850 [Polyplosphaeria fusca]